MCKPKDRYSETFETWDKVAQLYEDKFMNLDLYNNSYDEFCGLLPIGAKVLDVGCGPGNVSKYLLSKRDDLEIFGVDVSPNMIELAHINNPQAKFAVMDCRDIGSIDSKFDAIISGFFLPYISQGECVEFISNCNNILHDRGSIYLSFLEGDRKDSGFQTGSSGDRVYFNYHNLEVVMNELKEKGFRQVQVSKVEFKRSDVISEYHTIIMARKERKLVF